MSLCSPPNGLVFYSNPLLWVCTIDCRPICPLWGGGGGRGGSGFKWVSLRRCVKCNFGARYLLHQTQSRDRHPFWFRGTQGTWGLSSAEHSVVQPCDHDLNPAVNPDFDVRNGFIHFAARIQLKLAIRTSASLPITPSTKRENKEKCFRWS